MSHLLIIWLFFYHHITYTCYSIASYRFWLWYKWSLWCCFVLLRGKTEFLFLSHVQVFLCEILTVWRLKYPCSCFSSNFCFLISVVLLILMVSLLLLATEICLSLPFIIIIVITHTHTHTRLHTHTHTHTHKHTRKKRTQTYLQLCECACVYMCVYVYVCAGDAWSQESNIQVLIEVSFKFPHYYCFLTPIENSVIVGIKRMEINLKVEKLARRKIDNRFIS